MILKAEIKNAEATDDGRIHVTVIAFDDPQGETALDFYLDPAEATLANLTQLVVAKLSQRDVAETIKTELAPGTALDLSAITKG